MADTTPTTLYSTSYDPTTGLTSNTSAPTPTATSTTNTNPTAVYDPTSGNLTGYKLANGTTQSLQPQSTTTLSSNKSTDIANINTKQTDLSNSGITSTISADGTPTSTYANGTIVQPATANPTTTTTNQTNADGTSTTGGYNGNIYVRPGDPIPLDASGKPITLTTTSPQDDANKTQILNLMSQFDAQGAAQLQNIAKTYDNLIAQQTQANAAQKGQIQNALLMGGATGQGSSAQYAPISSAGILSSQISYGLQQLSNLNAQKQQAITAAQQAITAGDFQYAQVLQAQAEKITTMQQTEMNKMNDAIIAKNQKLAEEKLQITKDNAIADIYSSGITDPLKILAALKKAGTSNINLDDISKTLKVISDNAPSADYLAYQRDTQAKGLVPLNYTDWKDAEAKKASTLKSTEAYNTAYQSAKGKAAGEASVGSGITGGYNGTTQKQQIALEQQYRQILGKEFSARTGALGIENAKVNQANHLDSLLKQYYDPKTGNYNVPTAQYAELVMGLAGLVSPTAAPTDSVRQDLMQKTAAGDLKGAIQFVTGIPQNGNTQEIIKNLVDSIDRQAQTAVANRQAALDNMKDLAPTDLDPARVDALNQATNMVNYTGQTRLDAVKEQEATTNLTNYLKTNYNTPLTAPVKVQTATNAVPAGTTLKTLGDYTAYLLELPGATPSVVYAYLQANGYNLQAPTTTTSTTNSTGSALSNFASLAGIK